MWININLSKIALVFFAIAVPMWLITVAITYFDNDPVYEVRFDCRQAAFRVDYPIEVKEKCRKLMKKYNEQIAR